MEMTYFLIKAFVYLGSLVISLYGLKALQYEKALKKGHVKEAQVLYILLAMALAYLVGSFLLQFAYWF